MGPHPEIRSILITSGPKFGLPQADLELRNPPTFVNINKNNYQCGIMPYDHQFLNLLSSSLVFKLAHIVQLPLFLQICEAPYTVHITTLYILRSWAMIYFWTHVFGDLSHSLKGCPEGHSVLPFCWDIDSQTQAVSDYYGVINLDREDFPWRRNMKICTLLYKQTLCPQELSLLVEAHALLAHYMAKPSWAPYYINTLWEEFLSKKWILAIGEK